MQTIPVFLFGLALLVPPPGGPESSPALPTPALERVPDLTLLQEMLRDRQNPRGQSQAALLLLQDTSPEAEIIVRQVLQQTEDSEGFQAMALAVRLCLDSRFSDELVRALTSPRSLVRQTAAETLAVLPDPRLLAKLQTLLDDTHADVGSLQAAIWVLGRSGRKQAVRMLLELLENDNEALRRSSGEALAEISGQNYALDVTRWQAWWDRHKDLTPEHWLEHRLAYQAVHSRRLEGELERTRAQMLRLHQQLYARLPVGDRLGYIQSVADQEDAAVRLLAVNWILELLAAPGSGAMSPSMPPDAARPQALSQLLLRLSQDGCSEVQRAAVLGLGRVNDSAAFERLHVLLQEGRPCIRAGAARSLALQARGSTPEAQQRQKVVVPALQKALDDPALEVVVEAAEALGTLGALEAGPVLTGLLQHPSGHVRQTAAQALERVADSSLVDGLLKGLGDPSVNVRFSLLGALTRAVGRGANLGPTQYSRLMNRLETLVLRDVDPGVRSRAATVLGEVGPPTVLPLLWQCVRASEDSRVQEKAWAAFVEVLVRAAKLPLLREWNKTLAVAQQKSRRLQLLTEVKARWQKTEETRPLAVGAQELLVEAQLESGRWSAAFSQLRELLTRPATAAEEQQRLKWLLRVGELALAEGNRAETLRVVAEAQPYLLASSDLAQEFDQLARKAAKKE
jgi:HEAT repeat protein